MAYYASYFMPSIANIINVQFRRNSVAAGNGGGLYITNTASVLTNVTAFDNRAAGGSGGAMCIGGIGAPATVALVGGSITHNEATMGGGIAISDDGSALSVTRTRISHNHAVEGSGGGIAIIDDAAAVVVMRNGVVLGHNTASNDGGALSLGDGGATLQVVGDATMHANSAASGNGGGILLGTGASLESFEGCQSITLNAITTTGEWTAAAFDGWLALAAVDGDDGAALSPCCVDALGRATRVGRDEILREVATGTFAMTACLRPGSYTASWANKYGGNVELYNFKPVLLDAATSVDGEVLFAQTSAPATFRVRERGGVLSLTNNSAGLDGGGMWVGRGARAETAGLVVSGNRASRDGGGVHVYQGALEMVRGNVEANTAGRDGGGLSLGLFGAAALNATRCVENVASGDGGGIAATKYARLVVGASDLVGNTAGLNGGGCAMSEMPGTVSTLANCTVARNTAREGYGGGVSARDAGLALEATRVISNEAQGGSGGGIASITQTDPFTTLTTFEAREATGCVTVEIQIDWLSVRNNSVCRIAKWLL